MLTAPRTAEEAFQRLSPDMQELADCIAGSVLGSGERTRLANMVAMHFADLASKFVPTKPRLVFDRSRSG
jgi:hypothetical protein